MTVEEAEALAGTIWKDARGRVREVVRVEVSHAGGGWVYGDVYWKRPGGKVRRAPFWLPHFSVWLKTATKVEVDHGNE